MSNHFTILHKEDKAHSEGIWAVTWVRDEINNTDQIITGGADGIVKVFRKIIFLGCFFTRFCKFINIFLGDIFWDYYLFFDLFIWDF